MVMTLHEIGGLLGFRECSPRATACTVRAKNLKFGHSTLHVIFQIFFSEILAIHVFTNFRENFQSPPFKILLVWSKILHMIKSIYGE